MEVLTAWKAVRSVATVTGDEVLGEVNDAGSAWKAVRLRKCHMYLGVVPSRHIVFASPIRALRTRLPSLRSVVPSRHKRCMYINQFQDKTNPSLVTGLRCKLYTRNPFDYRRLRELVLG